MILSARLCLTPIISDAWFLLSETKHMSGIIRAKAIIDHSFAT